VIQIRTTRLCSVNTSLCSALFDSCNNNSLATVLSSQFHLLFVGEKC
jgi:hypothetical protein